MVQRAATRSHTRSSAPAAVLAPAYICRNDREGNGIRNRTYLIKYRQYTILRPSSNCC
jgi:hypothetical protein